MKYEIVNPEKEEPTYPRFGVSCKTKRLVIQIIPKGDWVYLEDQNNCGIITNEDFVDILPSGTQIVFTQ